MTNLQLFQNLNKEMFLEVLDVSFKSVNKTIQPSESFAQYKKISSQLGVEFSEFESPLQLLQQILKDAVKRNKSLSQLQDELLNIGLSEEQVAVFSKQWEKVYSSLVPPVTEVIPINPLIDMDWKFGVTSASSQLNTVGNVFLLIKLEVDQGNGKTKTVSFELQLSEFYAFLHEMERARASLDYLS